MATKKHIYILLIFSLQLATFQTVCSQSNEDDKRVLKAIDSLIQIPDSALQLDIIYGDTKALLKDSSALKFIILHDKTYLHFYEDSLEINNGKKLDDFITTHLNSINNDKIILVGSGNTEYGRFFYLLKALKKFKLYAYQLLVL